MPSGGSHPRYSDQLRKLIEASIAAGVRTCEIASYFRVSEPMVSQLRGLYDTFGTVLVPALGVQGRPRKIHMEAEEGVVDFLEEYPTARQDEVCDFLLDEYDISTSPSLVCRLLKRLRISSKLIERTHAEQDPALRVSYLANLTQYTADQLVYVDESASNERTKDRKYGWSPKGMPCRVRLPGKRSKRWSILPAIGIGGYLDWDVYHGSYNAERFNLFIERLLLKMTPYPGPRSVLIMDNASTHHNQYLGPMCAAAGVRVEYLPPYSPDLNPIELSFHELKAWMRKERELSYEFGIWFEGFIAMGLRLVVTEDTARGYFRHCGVYVPEDLRDISYSEL